MKTSNYIHIYFWGLWDKESCRTSANSHDVIKRERGPLPIPGREEVEEMDEGQVHLQAAGTGTGAIDFSGSEARRYAEVSEFQKRYISDILNVSGSG